MATMNIEQSRMVSSMPLPAAGRAGGEDHGDAGANYRNVTPNTQLESDASGDGRARFRMQQSLAGFFTSGVGYDEADGLANMPGERLGVFLAIQRQLFDTRLSQLGGSS